MKLYRYWKVSRQLQRERSDSRALTRCIQELRMKGASFDLSKEPQNARRMKSSSLIFPASKFILCISNFDPGLMYKLIEEADLSAGNSTSN
ncbi:hypothetical protein BVC80_1799g5 [Macleaya cordata]|uniref:Uncharacterized protein n=1 Tax=Macleaya cordata TaxID=56857 RepID=A0A200QPC9_MACCD|nr:hypothetical protein BVC80_1799g5 [Macleaya cordata]